MFFLFSLFAIIAYFFNGYLGFFISLIFSIFVICDKKKSFYFKIFELLIFSLPMEYIGIFGAKMNHVFSYYNIFLLILIISVFMNKNRISNIKLTAILIFFSLIILSVLMEENLLDNFIEVFQMILIIVPIFILYNSKKIFFNQQEINNLIEKYSNVCVTTALAMLLQFLLYNKFGLQVGFFSFGAGRVSYYCLFKGASVLPIFMGIGFLLMFINYLNFETKNNTFGIIIKMLIIFSATILNSSRSALAILLICILLALLGKYKNKMNIKTIFMFVVVAIGAYFGINYIMNNRINLNGFLDDNGRFETFKTGIMIWTSSFKRFFLGAGFKSSIWEGVTKPHNFIIQSLSQCGIIVTTILLLWIISCLLYNKSRYRLLLIYIILSCMLITDFYANSFITIIIILINEFRKFELLNNVDVTSQNLK